VKRKNGGDCGGAGNVLPERKTKTREETAEDEGDLGEGDVFPELQSFTFQKQNKKRPS